MAYKNPDDAKRWHANNKPRKHAYMRQYRLDNIEAVTESSKRWRSNNPERCARNSKAWAAKNPDKVLASKAKYAAKHKERLTVEAREYQVRRRETDENFKILGLLRCRLYSATKASGGKKSANTRALVGCDIQFLRGFLEARFLPGMTWKNHGKGKGKWQIDHYIPCAEFDLREEHQQKQAFHYSNLRPMWGPENQSKGAKRPPTHQAELI